MGYELNKLMQQFGVSTPGVAAYAGTAKPVAPTAPDAASKTYATDVDKYNKDVAAFRDLSAKYDTDQAAYNQYKQDYMNRVMNTPMYLAAQYNTGNRPMSNAMLWQMNSRGLDKPAAAQTIGESARSWLAANPNATTQQIEAARKGVGMSQQDVYDATGSYWGNQLAAPRYVQPVQAPVTEITLPKPVTPPPVVTPPTVVEEPVVDYNAWSGGGGGGDYSHGGQVHDMAQKYNVGGAVRRFRFGGADGEDMPMPAVTATPGPLAEPVTESPAVQPVTPQASAPTPVSPAANDLMSMLQRYGASESVYGPELKAARQRSDAETKAFSDMIQNAMKGQSSAPDKSEMYFRLAAAFGAPTRTGHFAETLAGVGKELGEYAKESRLSKKADQQLQMQLALEAQKMRAQGAREELTSLRTLAGEEMKDRRALISEYIKSGRPQSEAGKAAVDAGLQQGTPEFANFVNKYIEEKLTSGNLLKEAMVAIAAGQLKLAQTKEERQAEAGKKLSPGEMKLKTETEDRLQTLDNVMRDLSRAYDLNKNSFDSTLKDKATLAILEQTGSKDPRVLSTQEMLNLLKSGMISGAAEKMKGVLSDSDIKLLTGVAGIDAKSREERAQILKNTYRAMKAGRSLQQKRLNEISQGLYRETAPATAGGEIE